MVQTPAPHLAVIFGPYPAEMPPGVQAALRERRVICTWAGVAHALALDLLPEAVCGPPGALPVDTRARLHEAGTRFLPVPMEHAWHGLDVALNYAVTTGAQEIWVVGIADATLMGTVPYLFILARASWGGARLSVFHGSERGDFLRHGEGSAIAEPPGTPVVLVPLTPTVTGVTTQGLTPPLRGATLSLDEPMRVRVLTSPAHVWIDAGRLLVLYPCAGQSAENEHGAGHRG